MSEARSVQIRCPATSANLGPGYDALGLALTLYNDFRVFEAEDFQLSAEGPGAEGVPNTPSQHKLVLAFQAAREALGLPPVTGLGVHAQVGVPPSRGLGSSATATVAGVLAAEALSEGSLSEQQRVELAVELEGHPDNALPCLLGGLCAATRAKGRTFYQRGVPPSPPALVVGIPRDFELSTELMRAILPREVSFADATQNVGRTALLVFALLQGGREALEVALDDRLHQPYRGGRIPGFAAVREAALKAGAYGLVISGSGPSLLAMGPQEASGHIERALRQTWAEAGIEADARALEVDVRGAWSSLGG